MPKAPVYNLEGEAAGEMELADAIFGVAPKESVVHQVYAALMANARQPWADTKKRGEVRGGGKKPWKQKGTGRARHGSIRSPIWKGGGVAFGPQSSRSYKQKINKKMNRLAVKMCLSDKLREKKFVVVDTVLSEEKTKAMAAWRNKLPGAGKTTLLVAGSVALPLRRAIRNVKGFAVGRATDLTVLDLLHHQYLIVTKEAIGHLEKRLV